MRKTAKRAKTVRKAPAKQVAAAPSYGHAPHDLHLTYIAGGLLLALVLADILVY